MPAHVPPPATRLHMDESSGQFRMERRVYGMSLLARMDESSGQLRA